MEMAVTEYAGSIVATFDASTNQLYQLLNRLRYHRMALDHWTAHGDAQQILFWQTACNTLQAKIDKSTEAQP